MLCPSKRLGECFGIDRLFTSPAPLLGKLVFPTRGKNFPIEREKLTASKNFLFRFFRHSKTSRYFFRTCWNTPKKRNFSGISLSFAKFPTQIFPAGVLDIIFSHFGASRAIWKNFFSKQLGWKRFLAQGRKGFQGRGRVRRAPCPGKSFCPEPEKISSPAASEKKFFQAGSGKPQKGRKFFFSTVSTNS